MEEESEKQSNESRERDIRLSHPVVRRVLSKISQMERKKEEESLGRETSKEEEAEPRGKDRRVTRKINSVVKIVSLLVVLFFAGWFLVMRPNGFKTWLVDHYSILTHKVIEGKNSVWIKKKIPITLKRKEASSPKGKAEKDVQGIPVYIRATRIKIFNQDNVSTFNFTTSDPMDRVVNFYLKEMEGKGYRLVKNDYFPGVEIAQLVFSQEGKDCTISLVQNENGGVNVAISYIE
jgi:hypothetical protein